ENIEIRNRMEVHETYRPYSQKDLGRRIRMVWEGSGYRGRGRQTIWDGQARREGNIFEVPTPINFWNIDKQLNHEAPGLLTWKSLTTGGFAGIDVFLREAGTGTLRIDTPLIKETIKVNTIGIEPLIFENGGIKRRLQVYRLPDQNNCRSVKYRPRVPLHKDQDNAI